MSVTDHIEIVIKQNLTLNGRIKFKNHIFVKQNDSLILQSFIMNSVALTIRIKFSVVSFYHLIAVEPPLSKLWWCNRIILYSLFACLLDFALVLFWLDIVGCTILSHGGRDQFLLGSDLVLAVRFSCFCCTNDLYLVRQSCICLTHVE